MAFISVSHHVRSVVTTLLADPKVGFNPTLQTICDGYKINPFVISFGTIGRGNNFFSGYYGPKVLDETTSFKYPAACIYTIKSANTNQTKFLTFSGSVMLGLDVYLAFNKSAAPIDTDTLGDACEDTLYNVFNSETNQSFWGDVLYNGDLLIQRGPVVLGATNWMQLIKSTLTFDLETPTTTIQTTSSVTS